MIPPLLVDLITFHPEVSVTPAILGKRPAAHVLAPFLAQLREAAQKAAQTGETVRVGRLVQSDSQVEVGVYVRRGWWVGACVGLRWFPGHPLRCEMRIVPLSAAMAWTQWIALGAGLVLGPVASLAWGGAFLRNTELRFFAGLAFGTALAVGLGFLLLRSGALTDTPASLEVTARVQRHVEALLRSHRREAAKNHGP